MLIIPVHFESPCSYSGKGTASFVKGENIQALSVVLSYILRCVVEAPKSRNPCSNTSATALCFFVASDPSVNYFFVG